jgi:hypothetical protein
MRDVFTRVNENWISSTDFKKSPITNFMEISPTGNKLIDVDGWIYGQMDTHDEGNRCSLRLCERAY